MKMENISIAYHRNGVTGAGFHIVLFTWEDDDGLRRPMQGILFEAPGYCAVLDVQDAARGNINFAAGNSWRGDYFEPALREVISGWGKSQ